MLKIEVKKTKEKEGIEMQVHMAGSLGTIIGEFCAVISSIKGRLSETDDEGFAERVFSSAVIGTAMGIDDDYVAKIIKSMIEKAKEEEDEKDE